MPAPQEGPTGTFSIWKPTDTEFFEQDFQAIATALSLAVADVNFAMTEGIVNANIDGHSLSGTARGS